MPFLFEIGIDFRKGIDTAFTGIPWCIIRQSFSSRKIELTFLYVGEPAEMGSRVFMRLLCIWYLFDSKVSNIDFIIS